MTGARGISAGGSESLGEGAAEGAQGSSLPSAGSVTLRDHTPVPALRAGDSTHLSYTSQGLFSVLVQAQDKSPPQLQI